MEKLLLQIIQDSDKYGILSDLVKTSGFLLAAASAIIFTWKRRAKWEPTEEDIPDGSQKVVGLISAIVIAVLWVNSNENSKEYYIYTAIISGSLCIFFLLIYSYLIALQTFDTWEIKNGEKNIKKIAGGFKLKPQLLVDKKKFITTQEYLEKYSFNPDKVWTRPSRALVKLLFIFSYIGLVFSGTIGIAAISVILSKKY